MKHRPNILLIKSGNTLHIVVLTCWVRINRQNNTLNKNSLKKLEQEFSYVLHFRNFTVLVTCS